MKYRALLLTAFIACVLSIATAKLADATLVGRAIPVFGDAASLVWVQNPGIVFGIQLPSLVQTLLISAAAIGIFFLAIRQHNKITRIFFGLVIGGALGNIIDRIPDGAVTDFIRIGSFPIFNTADSFISVGVALLIIQSLLQDRQNKKTRTNEGSAPLA